MKQIKVLLIAACTVFFFIATAAHVWACGVGIEPPDGAVAVEPGFWGVVVINCGEAPIEGSMRLKRIVDCIVETKAFDGPILGMACPASREVLLGLWVDVDLSGWVPLDAYAGAWVTNVKNFKIEGDLVSFDVQLKAYKPGP